MDTIKEDAESETCLTISTNITAIYQRLMMYHIAAQETLGQWDSWDTLAKTNFWLSSETESSKHRAHLSNLTDLKHGLNYLLV